MAEEKSAPKKEKPVKAASAPVEGGAAPAGEKKAKAPKAAGEKGGKPAAEGAAPAAAGAPGAAPAEGAPKGPSGEQKPVEMIHGVAKQPTAEDLLKEELGAIKVRKAKE